MKAPDITRWDRKPEVEGLLFFAQSVDELLFDYTIDTYKIPALNSRTLAIELFTAITECESGFLKQGTLKPIVMEFVYTLRKDPVAKELLGNQFEEFIRTINREQPMPELKTKLSYLLHGFEGSYFTTSMKLLRETIHYPKEKEKIMRLTRIYLNELINKGYSPQFTYFESRKFFFSSWGPQKIDSARIIDDCFNLFGFEQTHFDVLFRANNSFSLAKEYAQKFGIEVLDKAPGLDFSGRSDKIKSFLGANDDLPLFLRIRNNVALDEFKVRESALERLVAFDSLGRYHIHRRNLAWSDTALVYTQDQKKFGLCHKPRAAVMKRPDRPLEKLSNLVLETLANLTCEKLNEESTLRLSRALARHHSALSSETPENQLLEFWSAIEVLFPPSTDSGDRVAQISDSVTPFVCLEYAAKLAADLFLSIKSSGFPEGLQLLNDVPEGNNPIEKCLALISIETNQSVRGKFFQMFDWNPLLKNRIYSLNAKFSTADSALNTLNGHIQRVSWQIRRIYRARNLIIHSGRTLPYVNVLVENVHSYVDRILDVLNERTFHSPHRTAIDEISLGVKLETEAHLRILKELGKTKCLSDNYKLILFGNR
jgi:hypothetical protein